MTVFADIVMLAWPVIVIALFARLPSMKAAVTAFSVGWLFLPFKSYPMSGLPDITKMSLTCYSIFVATLLFDFNRILSLRPRLLDLPVVCVCVAPAISSLANQLGTYDAFAAFVDAVTSIGMPYFLGRIFVSDQRGLRFVALAIVMVTLCYLPLCWFEMRMSPQLHALVYGENHRAGGGQTIRLGGYRPAVFLDTGLQLGMWMTNASLIGVWLWWTGVWRRTLNLPAGWWLAALVGTTILCRSTGALLLLAIGIAALAFTKVTGSRMALVGLLLVVPIFIFVRVSGSLPWEPAVELAKLVDEERAASLEGRFENEEILMAKAMQRPLFGWGGWGRNRVHDEYGDDITVTDGRWIIKFGTNGLVGMTADFAILLAPLVLVLLRHSGRHIVTATVAPQLALGVAVALYAIDCLLNNMPNPIYLVAAGGVIGCEDFRPETIHADAVPSPLNNRVSSSPSIVPRQLGKGRNA